MADQKIKILHLEDSAPDSSLIQRQLQKAGLEFELLLVEDEAGFTSGLTDFLPDIILSDHSLPSFNSLAALRIIRERKITVPFILITGTTSEENVVTIMREGAWDYILKDNLKRLPTAVTQALEKYNSIQAKAKAECELAMAHQKILFHLENSPLGFVEWDDRFKIKSWSKRAEEIFGWSEDEIFREENAGQNHIYSLDQAWIAEIAEELLLTKQERTQIVNSNSTKSGTTIWCEWHISLQKDESGKITTLMSLVSDITERKKTEERLEKMVRQRTQDLKAVNEHLQEAKLAADAANLTKSQFLANMSHEIRTPLNAVLGLTHLALKTELTPKQTDYLKKIQSSSDSLLSIINDILDFSKVESGKLRLEEVTFDLEDVFQKLADIITYKAESKGLEIVFGIDSKVPKYLIGDPSNLERILINLLSNAVKFTDKGEVVVNVSCQEIQDERIKLHFTVSDTGIGMDDAQMSILFQPFTQADNSISRKYGGTGLGLSIIKRLVELMQGAVSVQSAPGTGTTFTFTVWMKVQKKQRILPAPSVDPRQLNVMVVEDNQSSMRILKEMLESFSFNVITMDSALNAIHYLKNNFYAHPVQLVLMDAIIPPGIDGLEAVSIIRQDAELKDIKIIMMCKNNRYDMLYHRAEELQLSGILIKPLRYSEAYDSIMNAIENNARVGFEKKYALIQNNSSEKFYNGHLLLVEDNDINQQVATELLMGFGFTVDIASNGLEAVGMCNDSIQKSKYDLILMDLQMPVMGGIAATQEIRKNKEFSDLPIIAMTADAIVGVKENCLAAGMMDFIAKPINPEQMISTIEKWLKPGAQVQGALKVQESRAKHKAIPSLPGIDQDDGLGHLGNNSSLYRDLLLKFVKTHGNFIAELVNKFNSGDREEARRMLHTLKGMSGNLGMIKLHQKCLDAEVLLIKARDIQAIVGVIEEEINMILEGLRRNLIEENVPPHIVTELVHVKPLISRLAGLLKENDPEASNVLKQIGTVKGYEIQLQEIEKSLSKYDFDKAIATLNELKSKLN